MSRPQSGNNDLDWLKPTTSAPLAMDDSMLFSSFKDTFVTENNNANGDDFSFGDGLQLPLPGLEANTVVSTEQNASYFGDSDVPEFYTPAQMANDGKTADLPNLSINTDVLNNASQLPLPRSSLPALASAQPTPAWMNATTPFSALQSGQMNTQSTLQVLTPKSSISANYTRDPLQLGPGWTETVQMANLMAADGSGQYFSFSLLFCVPRLTCE